MTLQKRINLEICREYVGGLQTVLVEGKGKLPGQVSGKADNCRIVNFVGDTSLIGSFVQVRIAKAYPNSLLGELEK